MNTPTPSPRDPFLHEELLELLAEHIAANDRVVHTVERVEKQFPQEAARLLQEHRQSIVNLTPPPTTPSVKPVMTVPVTDLTPVHLWGCLLLTVLVLSTCILMALILRR